MKKARVVLQQLILESALIWHSTELCCQEEDVKNGAVGLLVQTADSLV